MTDVALDPYTSHGHDGLLIRKIDNDKTIKVLINQSLLQVKMGLCNCTVRHDGWQDRLIRKI